MAAAFQRDQWRRVESTDSGAESGSEEVATPADPAKPWKVPGTEYIFVPKGTCRAVNSDQAPLTNVVGRPPVATACSRPGKEKYKGRCRYHASSINQALPNMIYARLCGSSYRFVVPSQREPTPEEYHQLFGDERIRFDAEGELLLVPEVRGYLSRLDSMRTPALHGRPAVPKMSSSSELTSAHIDSPAADLKRHSDGCPVWCTGASARRCRICAGFDCLRRGANQRRRRLHMDESLQKLLGRWSDRSLKGEKMHLRYDELNLEDFVNATKPL